MLSTVIWYLLRVPCLYWELLLNEWFKCSRKWKNIKCVSTFSSKVNIDYCIVKILVIVYNLLITLPIVKWIQLIY